MSDYEVIYGLIAEADGRLLAGSPVVIQGKAVYHLDELVRAVLDASIETGGERPYSPTLIGPAQELRADMVWFDAQVRQVCYE